MDKARAEALRMYALLVENDLPDLAGGVAAILGELDAVDELGVDTALRNARSLFRSMTGGAGSLLDAFISHEDFDEQARLNDELTASRNQLSNLLRQPRETSGARSRTKLPLARFRCRNRHEFDAPTPTDGNGQLVLRSASGELVSVDAFDDPVFSEAQGMVRSLDAVAALDDARRGAVVRAAFEATLDPDSQGRPFTFSMHPPCPECGTTTMDWFELADPPQQVEVEVTPATHGEWERLDDKAKLEVVRDAVRDALSA